MPESKNTLSNPQYSRQITRKNEFLSNKKNAPGLHFSNNVFEVIGTVSRQFITFLPKHFECKETPNFPPLRSFCAQKAVAFVVFCSLVFVLLVGFGFVYVFARSKFFRKKKKRLEIVLITSNTILLIGRDRRVRGGGRARRTGLLVLRQHKKHPFS